MTKAEVEARLEQRSDSISDRIEAIESELPGRTSRIRKFTLGTPAVKVGLAVATGLIVGAMVLRRKKEPADLYREGLDDLSVALSKEIMRNVGRGMDTDEAISEAMQKRPPIVHVGNKGSGFVSTLASQLSRHVLSILGPVIANRIVSRIRKKDASEK